MKKLHPKLQWKPGQREGFQKRRVAHTAVAQALVLGREEDPLSEWWYDYCGWDHPDYLSLPLLRMDAILIGVVAGSAFERGLSSPSVRSPSEPEKASQAWFADELAADIFFFMGQLVDPKPTLVDTILAELPNEEVTCLAFIVQSVKTSALRQQLLLAGLFSRFWVRSPLTFETTSSMDSEAGVNAFIQHVFVLYPVPPSLNAAWCQMDYCDLPDLTWVTWFLLSAQGGSVERAAGLFGWQIPTGLFSIFCKLDTASPVTAYSLAWVMKAGGSERVHRWLELDRGFQFWVTLQSKPQWVEPADSLHRAREAQFHNFACATVKWLDAQPTLTDEMVELLLPWAFHMYTEQEAGRAVFSWKGRTAARVVQLAQDYQATRTQQQENLTWPPQDLDWTTQPNDNEQIWNMQELTTSKQLLSEGKAMHHCVAYYAKHCAAGQCAIFSLTLNGSRVGTIEIHPTTLHIVQARGIANSGLSPSAMQQVGDWRKWCLSKRAACSEDEDEDDSSSF